MTIKHPEDFAGLEPPQADNCYPDSRGPGPCRPPNLCKGHSGVEPPGLTPDLVKIADALVRSMALSPTSDKARAAGLLALRTSPAGYQPARVTEFYRAMSEWCAQWAEEGK